MDVSAGCLFVVVCSGGVLGWCFAFGSAAGSEVLGVSWWDGCGAGEGFGVQVWNRKERSPGDRALPQWGLLSLLS